MKTILMSLVLSITVFGFAVSTIADTPQPQPKHFFAPLSNGQNVFLIEHKSTPNYEIRVMKVKEGVTHEITEIGPDYINIRDLNSRNEFRIPIYNIKLISVIAR